VGGVMRGVVKGNVFLRNVGVEVGMPAPARDEEAALGQWMDERGWPAKPLRVGIIAPQQIASELVSARGVFLPEWVNMRGRDVQSVTELDVLVQYHENDGSLTVYAAENPGFEAAWYDWSSERPLSFPSVFPTRCDCAQVTIGADGLGRIDALLARLLIEAAALYARHPARLTVEDRISGRNAAWASHLSEATDEEPMTTVMKALTAALLGADSTTRQSPGAKCAARVLSAWAAGACGTLSAVGSGVDAGAARGAAEAAWDVNAHEAETALRVAVVRLAQMDDPAGMAGLEHAANLLRGRSVSFPPDQVEFVLSELKTQAGTADGVARVCAGVVLVGATLPEAHVPAFRSDVLDDARLSGALLGQEQDEMLILQTFRMIERRAGLLGHDAQGGAVAGVIGPKGEVNGDGVNGEGLNGDAVRPVERFNPGQMFVDAARAAKQRKKAA
jgi:hypothetical protein